MAAKANRTIGDSIAIGSDYDCANLVDARLRDSGLCSCHDVDCPILYEGHSLHQLKDQFAHNENR